MSLSHTPLATNRINQRVRNILDKLCRATRLSIRSPMKSRVALEPRATRPNAIPRIIIDASASAYGNSRIRSNRTVTFVAFQRYVERDFSHFGAGRGFPTRREITAERSWGFGSRKLRENSISLVSQLLVDETSIEGVSPWEWISRGDPTNGNP